MHRAGVPWRAGRSSLRATVFAVAVAALGTVAACAKDDSFVTLGSGVSDQGFAAPDAGDDAADAAPALCVATTCPAPWATCAAPDGTLPTYACGTDTSGDLQHCGACNNECRTPSPAYHVHMECTTGQCRAFCNEHFADCNGVPDDGCEASTLDDRANCGACGVKCAAGVSCTNGKCGCPPGLVECEGKCVDVTSNDAHCGACGFSCADHQPADAGAVPPHMVYACAQGQCTDLRCVQNGSEFWADCNHATSTDGCEIDLRKDPSHCGACGNACDPGQQCFEESGVVACQCKSGQTLCGARTGFPASCVDTENDPRNCGACGYVCPYVPNARPVCSHGRCNSECLPGTADCNGRDDDGCEVDLGKDPRHCGGCGAACDVARGQPCVGGRCLTRDCNGPVTK